MMTANVLNLFWFSWLVHTTSALCISVSMKLHCLDIGYIIISMYGFPVTLNDRGLSTSGLTKVSRKEMEPLLNHCQIWTEPKLSHQWVFQNLHQPANSEQKCKQIPPVSCGTKFYKKYILGTCDDLAKYYKCCKCSIQEILAFTK